MLKIRTENDIYTSITTAVRMSPRSDDGYDIRIQLDNEWHSDSIYLNNEAAIKLIEELKKVLPNAN